MPTTVNRPTWISGLRVVHLVWYSTVCRSLVAASSCPSASEPSGLCQISPSGRFPPPSLRWWELKYTNGEYINVLVNWLSYFHLWSWAAIGPAQLSGPHTHTLYIYIYIYICVCVCVLLWALFAYALRKMGRLPSKNNKLTWNTLQVFFQLDFNPGATCLLGY